MVATAAVIRPKARMLYLTLPPGDLTQRSVFCRSGVSMPTGGDHHRNKERNGNNACTSEKTRLEVSNSHRAARTKQHQAANGAAKVITICASKTPPKSKHVL